jgi:hypothetical protein
MWELRVLLIKPPTTMMSANRAKNARQKWSEQKDQQVEIELCNKNAGLSVVAAIWRASATLLASHWRIFRSHNWMFLATTAQQMIALGKKEWFMLRRAIGTREEA